MQKDIYESLRAGKSWNRTLFLIIYDDAGGFYDSVIPPFEGVPNDEADCHVKDGCPTTFDFRRLGSRLPALLISPWVRAGSVFQEPTTKGNSSQFELSSVPATLKRLFNLSSFLTKRDAWAGSFDELLLPTGGEPRIDTPLHLPEAPSSDKVKFTPG